VARGGRAKEDWEKEGGEKEGGAPAVPVVSPRFIFSFTLGFTWDMG